MTNFARFLALASLATLIHAQQGGGGTTAPAPAPSPAPTNPSTGGGNNRGPVIVPQQPSQPAAPPRIQQPIFITGNVALPDGTEPPERVLIERLCANNNVRSEGYTDSKGRFSIQLGQSLQLVPDASQTMFLDGTQGFAGTTRSENSMATNADPYFDCELRARLAGYRSSTILLAGRRPMDNPAVGTLVIIPLAATDGTSISGTAGGASKDAKKAYDKGVSEMKKQKWESAEKELRKAVALHPKYADAWLELGKSHMARKQLDPARDAFQHAIDADPQYVYPYEQLYMVSFEQSNWTELAELTEKLLRLNPYEFPGAYYFHGVSQYALKNWDAAEKSLVKAVEADTRGRNPKTHYVLGLTLAQKRDYAGAKESLTIFSQLAPNDPNLPKVRALLEEIEKAAR